MSGGSGRVPSNKISRTPCKQNKTRAGHDRLAPRARGLPALSTSTILRILHAAGLITPEPRKRPRSSYPRFEMAHPNELWQSGFIHWHLADGTDVQVLNCLDDHSRHLLAGTAHEPAPDEPECQHRSSTSNTSRLPSRRRCASTKRLRRNPTPKRSLGPRSGPRLPQPACRPGSIPTQRQPNIERVKTSRHSARGQPHR